MIWVVFDIMLCDDNLVKFMVSVRLGIKMIIEDKIVSGMFIFGLKCWLNV